MVGRWSWHLAIVIAAVTLAGVAGAFAHAEGDFPARLHEGTCAALGTPVVDLAPVGAADALVGSPTPIVQHLGAVNRSVTVLLSATTIDSPLPDLVETEHAVVVSERRGRTSHVIACGDVSGPVLS